MQKSLLLDVILFLNLKPCNSLNFNLEYDTMIQTQQKKIIAVLDCVFNCLLLGVVLVLEVSNTEVLG
jgi:hypothetical protein